jgi:putative NADPH-quinone reductase
MKISVILGHPDINSFNCAIADMVVKTLRDVGHEVVFHDLYREEFPPVIPAEEIPKDVPLPDIIAKYCHEISEADGIIIIHPNWWGQPPAILKGWIDRVLRPGVAYRFAEGDAGDGELIGLLKAEQVIIFNTSNTPVDREQNLYGDPLGLLWKNNMLISCGVRNYYRKNFSVIVTSTQKQRQQWLREAAETVLRYFPSD